MHFEPFYFLLCLCDETTNTTQAREKESKLELPQNVLAAAPATGEEEKGNEKEVKTLERKLTKQQQLEEEEPVAEPEQLSPKSPPHVARPSQENEVPKP